MFDYNGKRYSGIIKDDVANGEGLGLVFFVQGCSHNCTKTDEFHCKGCHNPQTWDYDGGKPLTDEVINSIWDYFDNTPFATRLTITGGEPFDLNYPLTVSIVKEFKERYPDKKVWVYTGFEMGRITFTNKAINRFFWTLAPPWFKYKDSFPEYKFGDIVNVIRPFFKDDLPYFDIIVDGYYQDDKRDITLPFRGSSNQRLIDVKKTSEAGKIVLYELPH